MEKNKKLYELIVSLTLLAASAFLLIVAYRTKSGMSFGGMMSAMDFPKVLLYGLLAFSIFLTAKCLLTWKKTMRSGEAFLKTDKRIWISVALIVGYILFWRYISFSLGTFLYLTVQAKVLDKSLKWRNALIVSAVSTVVIVAVFKFLFSINLSERLLNAIGIHF